MISMCKKYWSRLKNKVCPALLSICLISCICSPFASADYTGNGSVSFSQLRRVGDTTDFTLFTNIGTSGSLPFSNTIISSVYDDNRTSYGGFSLNSIEVPDAVFTSTVSIYFSCFSAFIINSSYYRPPAYAPFGTPTFTLNSADPDTGVVSQSSVGVSTFVPNSPQAASNTGILLDARLEPSTLAPVTDISITSSGCLYLWDAWNQFSETPFIQVVSFRVVTTDSTAEIEGLEAIADQIVAQSEMMSAFYGDIISVCNEIYSRLGDMQATAELANVYFQQMIELLKHIDTTTTNIYNLLPTQFAMLETAIKTSTVDIVSAVEAQTAALISYFDSVFSGAVGDLPQKSDDLDTEVGNVGAAENEYKSNASATFEQLSADFTGFTGGTLSGIALASNLFTQVWNALGEYSVVYSFPLLFGLCLLLIGRLSKHSGGQSSTDKERGDSDA